MDREKASKILGSFGKPKIQTNNGTISFYRQDNKTIERIEKFSDKELMKTWRSYIQMCYGEYACFSLADLQMVSLLELEMDCRDSITDEDWDDLECFYEKVVGE